MDELTLTDWIARRQPADLSLPDGMHRLIALYRSPRTLCRTESEVRRDPLLDKTMVLLDDVVQIGSGSAATSSAQFTRFPQLGDGAGVRGMAVHIDYTRRGTATRQCQTQEQLRRNQVALGRNMNSIVSPAESMARYR